MCPLSPKNLHQESHTPVTFILMLSDNVSQGRPMQQILWECMAGKSFPTFTKSSCYFKEPDLYLKVKPPLYGKCCRSIFGGVCTGDVSYMPYQQNSLLTGLQAY